MPLASKLSPPQGYNFTLSYIRKTLNDFLSSAANRNLTKLKRVVPFENCSDGFGWLHKLVTGSKMGFQNATFKNLIVWNYKAQSFHIWYTASSRGPLPKLFKWCPWGKNWPRPGGHNFTLNYIWILQMTSSLAPLMGIWPNSTGMIPGWSPKKLVHMVLICCISKLMKGKATGSKSRFSKCTFQKSFCLKLQCPELSYLMYNIM